MNTKTLLTFISGLTVGGFFGFFGTKKYLENKYQKQYENDRAALEEYYRRTDEYIRIPYDKKNNEGDNISELETDSRPGGRMSSEKRAEIKEKLHKNWEGTTNYAGMYKGNRSKMNPVDDSSLPETENVVEDEKCENCNYFNTKTGECIKNDEYVNVDDSCSDFSSNVDTNNALIEETTPEEDVTNEHQKNMNKPPKIISAEAYSNLPPHIEQETLYLYAYDETLTDENDEPIDEPSVLVGDSLTKYNFIDSDEPVIFVMNYALDTCYEIQKIEASWTDSH